MKGWLLPLALAALCQAACSDSAGPRNPAVASGACRIRHEHELPEARAFSLAETVMVRLDALGAESRHAKDSGSVDTDVIVYSIDSETPSLRLVHDSDLVDELRLVGPLGSGGEPPTIQVQRRGDVIELENLTPGEYALHLRPGARGGDVTIHSTACGAGQRAGRRSGSAGASDIAAVTRPQITVTEFPGSPVIVGLPTAIAGFVGSMPAGPENVPVQILSPQEVTATFGAQALASPVGRAVDLYFQEGGVSAEVVRSSSSSAADLLQGLTALGNLDPPPGLLVFPEAGAMDPANATGFLRQTAQVAESMRSFVVAGVPAAISSVADAAAFGRALDASRLGLYYPRLVYVEGGSVGPGVDPAGVVAGRIAATDLAAGVFVAPAGLQNGVLQTPVGLTAAVTDADDVMLSPAGVNSIRNFAATGIRVWGARSTSKDPTLRYLPVVRTLNYLESSIRDGIRWVVFHPSDPTLWGTVNQQLTQFLTGFWQAGGLSGQTASQAFSVVVNATNNPPIDIAQGILRVQVSVAPVVPAEFVTFVAEMMVEGR